MLNGSFTVPVNVASAFYAYRLYLTPSVSSDVRRPVKLDRTTSMYQIYDLQGNRCGTVGVDGFKNLAEAVAKNFPGPKIYLARREDQVGDVQKVVVAAPDRIKFTY